MIQIVSISPPPSPAMNKLGKCEIFSKGKGRRICDWISRDFALVQMGDKKKKKETGASLNVCPVLSKTLWGLPWKWRLLVRTLGRLFDLAVSGVACLHVPRLERDEREKSGSQAGEREREREYQQKNKVK
jgi:hypothetical protein